MKNELLLHHLYPNTAAERLMKSLYVLIIQLQKFECKCNMRGVFQTLRHFNILFCIFLFISAQFYWDLSET